MAKISRKFKSRKIKTRYESCVSAPMFLTLKYPSSGLEGLSRGLFTDFGDFRFRPEITHDAGNLVSFRIISAKAYDLEVLFQNIRNSTSKIGTSGLTLLILE